MNLSQFKVKGGGTCQAWWTSYAAMLDAVQLGVSEQETLLSALQASMGGSLFGVQAGAVSMAVNRPTAQHTELTFPSGTDFVKLDYPDLYTNSAPNLTEWLGIASGTVSDLTDAIFALGRVIAIGPGKAIFSLADPWNDWIPAGANPGAGARYIAWNQDTLNPVAIAVGDGNYIGRSMGATLGEDWATIPSPIMDSQFNWTDLRWIGNVFVGLANKQITANVYVTGIGTSPDGFNWTLQTIIDGRYESIAFNNGDGGVNEFLIVGWGGLGSVYSVMKAPLPSGPWTGVTINNNSNPYLLNDVEYINASGSYLFAFCGYNGIIGGKTMGTTNASLAATIPGNPWLLGVAWDSVSSKFYSVGALVSGVSYVYSATPANVFLQWEPQAVGSAPLYCYLNAGGTRVITGASGSLFSFNGLDSSTFTLPYPASSICPLPFRYYVLTKTIPPPSEVTIVSDRDLSLLETNWKYVKIATSGTQYVTNLRISPSGVIAASGTNGLLSKSTDYGLTWTTIALPTSADCLGIEFMGEELIVIQANGAYTAASLGNMTLGTVSNINTNIPGAIVGLQVSGLTAYLIGGQTVTPNLQKKSVYLRGLGSLTHGEVVTTGARTFKILNYPKSFNPIVVDTKLLWPASFNDGSALVSSDNITSVPASASVIEETYIPGFSINNAIYSKAWDEILYVGDNGKMYRQNFDFGGPPTEIPTGIPFNIDGAGWGMGAWLAVSRRGLLVSTDSMTSVFYPGVVTASQVMYVPGKFKFIANALDEPGYVKICQL